MKPIHSFEALSPLLSAQLGRGVVTNAFLSADAWRAEIDRGNLRVHEWDGGLLLLRAREGYTLLNFYLRPPYALPQIAFDDTLVTELVIRVRDKTTIQLVTKAFTNAGFIEMLTRTRLSASLEARVAPVHTRTAREDDFSEVYALLHSCFNPLTGCLPSRPRLMHDIDNGLVTVSVNANGEIASLVHGGCTRSGAEIRHLCTSANARGMGYAQAALDGFLAHTNGNLQVWTATDNAPALAFYQKNGFAPDGFASTVLIRK